MGFWYRRSAYYVAVTLLFPFVAIRLVSSEKESGGRLAVQFPYGMGMNIAAKGIVLLFGWLLAWAPGVLAIVWWRLLGGHVYAPETLNLVFGRFCYAGRDQRGCGGGAMASAGRGDCNAGFYVGDMGSRLYRCGPRRVD
jgi:hypothetical protein